jgi:hypothetical protein
MCSVPIAGVARPAPAAAADSIKLLWRDPGPIALRDLYWGPGSADRAPKPPFAFVQENTSGTKPKIDATDATGASWSVKFATPEMAHNEVHAEIAASRLTWALGYYAEEHYLVPEGRIEGVRDLKRAAAVVGADGAFRIARFERRAPDVQKLGQWHVENNPFKGTRELAGLHILMMLIGNWDAQPTNAEITRVSLPNGDVEERYLMSDLGTAFGRMRGGLRQPSSRWNLKDYSEARFLTGVVQGRVVFRNPLLGNEPLAVPVEHARWFANLASQLTDRQVRRAFQAAGATPDEIAGFSAHVLRRIAELNAAVNK